MDNKLIGFNKGINSNKTKPGLFENELNKLSKRFPAISIKGLTKDLVNGYKILDGQDILS